MAHTVAQPVGLLAPLREAADRLGKLLAWKLPDPTPPGKCRLCETDIDEDQGGLCEHCTMMAW